MPIGGGLRLTERLRLEPIGVEHADELWRLHRDDSVAYWYGGAWSRAQAGAFAAAAAAAWQTDGVSKWIAYDRSSGFLVGRGGLSRLPANGSTFGQIRQLVLDPSWARHRLEIGWAIRADLQRCGYATEIGQEGLAFAREVLDAHVVVAFTEVHNLRSRAVMERLDMRHAGDIFSVGLLEGRDGVHDQAPFAVYVAGADRPA